MLIDVLKNRFKKFFDQECISTNYYNIKTKCNSQSEFVSILYLSKSESVAWVGSCIDVISRPPQTGLQSLLFRMGKIGRNPKTHDIDCPKNRICLHYFSL